MYPSNLAGNVAFDLQADVLQGCLVAGHIETHLNRFVLIARHHHFERTLDFFLARHVIGINRCGIRSVIDDDWFCQKPFRKLPLTADRRNRACPNTPSAENC